MNVMIAEITLGISIFVALIVGIEAAIKIKKWRQKRIQDKEYENFLNDPFKKIVFLIPRKDNFVIPYYEQKLEKHSTTNFLEIESNIKTTIFLMWTPRENFTTNNIYFGFDGKKGEKPKITDYNNPFITSSNNPEQSWMIDWHEDFHLTDKKHFYKHEYYVSGFNIQTKKPGIYDMYVKLPIICNRYKDINERRQRKIIIKKLKIKIINENLKNKE